MGYLVMKDTGAIQIDIDATTSEINYTDTLGAENPTYGRDYINLKAFSMSFDSEMDVDNSAILTEALPRITAGNNKAIPITFICNYDRNNIDPPETLDLTPVDIVEACIYLDKWAESKSIVLLYWMPNNYADITSGQCRDYYASLLRVLSTNKWGSAWLSKTNNSYSGAGAYSCYAIPLMINKVSMSESADTKITKVSIDCYLISRED